jgi:hypothetical protein
VPAPAVAVIEACVMTQTGNHADQNSGPTTPGTAYTSGTTNAPLARVSVG